MENNKTSIGRILIFNILSLVLGYLGGMIVYRLAFFIFVELLGQLRIASLISWPVDYSFYATIIVFFATAFTTIGIGNYFCKKSNFRIHFGTIILNWFYMIYYIIEMIATFATSGFSFSSLLLYIIAIGTHFMLFVETKSEWFLGESISCEI